MRRLLVALTTLVVGVATLLALANGPTQASDGPVSEPQCDPGDQVLVLDANRTGKGPGSSPEDAIEKEVRRIYPNLPASSFRRSRTEGNAVELVHERSGRRLVVVETEQVDGGWGLDRLVACNQVLTEPGGRNR